MEMLSARVVRLFALAMFLALPGIAHAQVVVGLYPVQGSLDPKLRADAEGLIASGVRASDQRRGTFILRGPVPLKANCGPVVTTECLAKLGRGGAIIHAEATPPGADGAVVVSMSLVTGQQQRTEPVTFRFIPGFLDLRPVNFAVEQLEKAMRQLPVVAPGADAAPRVAARPAPPADAPAVEAKPAPVQVSKPVAVQVVSEPVSADVDLVAAVEPEADEGAPVSKSSGWMRTTGIYASAGGALVFGAGAFFGLRSKSVSKDLTKRYQAGLLVPADRSKYDQVDTYNTLATGLMIGGGVVALTGLTFWGLSAVSFESDGDGGRLNVGGRW